MNKDFPIDKQKVASEEVLLRRTLRPHLGKIADIKEGYMLLFKIVGVLKYYFPQVDKTLNNYFIEILLFVESSYEEIETYIEERYYNDSSENLPSDFIHPQIFNGYFYKPFGDLHAGVSQIMSKKISWEELDKKMDECYTRIKLASLKIFNGRGIKPDHDDVLKSVNTYVKKFLPMGSNQPTLSCSGLKFNLKNGTLQYKNNNPLKVTIDGREMKFLRLLMEHRGQILRYETVASRLQMNFYYKGVTNEDAGEEIRYFKRDLVKILKRAGMKITEINKMITKQKNEGYLLLCQ